MAAWKEPGVFCGRKGQAAVRQTWKMQAWTGGVIYKVDST